MERLALVIGIEHPIEEGSFPKVAFAQRDAEEVASALKALGYSVRLLLNEQATRGRILSQAKQWGGAGEAVEQLLFFFAGPSAFCDGQQYLLSSDTDPADIEETAVALHEIFSRLGSSKARQRVLFIDGSLESFGVEEEGVIFTSCAPDERSWPSHSFQHGHWAYQLLRALRGDEPSLLKEGRLLAGPLQAFLQSSVQRELSLQSHGQKQTPQMRGGDEDSLVADLSPRLSARGAQEEIAFGEVKRAVFERIEPGLIRSLSGFNKKFHKVPDSHTSATKHFVRKIADPDIEREIEEAFQAIRGSKRYRNSEVQVVGETIATPDFKYSVSYEQAEEDSSRYELTRRLEDLGELALLDEPWFERYFGDRFDSIELSLFGELPLEKVIARAEELPAFQVDTDRHRSYCSISHPGFDGRIYILPESITFKFESCRPLKELLHGLNAGMNIMGQSEVIAKGLM